MKPKQAGNPSGPLQIGRMAALAARKWLAPAAALLGALVYLLAALQTLDTTLSFLDEGLYLYKGYLFASGAYTPFQDYGPWTNHLPLAFLIPGAAQILFGPGLETGRLFSIFASLWMLAGLWSLVRRLGGEWWAALAVWSMALSPAEIKLFTLGLPQSMVGCLFVWALALTLGEGRRTWQIALGAFLAAALLFVRENMAPVLPLLVLYIFWQHGKKAGWIAAATGLAAVLAGHALFWPNILRLWAGWLPAPLTPFLDAFRIPAATPFEMVFSPRKVLDTILLNFWLAIRLHPIAFLSAFAAWLLWPKRAKWGPAAYRAAVLLSALFVLLWLEHAWVAFSQTTCMDCILLYVGYFDFLGVILLAIAFPFLERRPSFLRSAFIGLFVLLTSICIAYSTYEDTGYPLTRIPLPRLLTELLLPGPTDIRRLLAYYHGFTGLQQRILLPSLAGLLFGLGLLFLAGLLAAPPRRARLPERPEPRQRVRRRFGTVVLTLLLGAAVLLSPTIVLSGGNDFFACGRGTVRAYAAAADEIQGIIGTEATVYWEGRSNVLFLYLPGARLYPPQLNHLHGFYLDGDSDALLKMGLWNLDLGRRWMQEADFVLIESGWLQDWEREILDSGGYTLLAQSPPLGNCGSAATIAIYQKP